MGSHAYTWLTYILISASFVWPGRIKVLRQVTSEALDTTQTVKNMSRKSWFQMAAKGGEHKLVSRIANLEPQSEEPLGLLLKKLEPYSDQKALETIGQAMKTNYR